MAAVQQNGFAIQHLTPEQRTPKVVMAAVQRYGYVIQYLTPEQRTPEVILAAAQQNAQVFRLISPEEYTHEVCMIAIKHLSDEQHERPSESHMMSGHGPKSFDDSPRPRGG